MGMSSKKASTAVLGLRENTTGCQVLLDTLPDDLIIINDQGIVLSINTVAEKQFGYQADDVVGQNVAILMSKPHRNQRDSYLGRNRLTGERRISGIGRVALGSTADGSTFPIELRVGECRTSEDRLLAGCIRDLTERPRERNRLQELQEELLRASRLGVIGELASGLAHELNQPLTAIISYVGACVRLLEREDGDRRPLRQVMNRAIGQANRARQILRSLRKFLSKSKTKHAIEGVNNVIEDAIALAGVGAHDEGIHVHRELSPNLPDVLIDRIQIQQVIVNLVRNAREALADVERGEISVTTRRSSDKMIKVPVANDGWGLSEDLSNRLFHPFATTREDGMSLGLTISRSIIEAHGGRLTVTPNPSGGVTFQFDLPIYAAAN
jgi:two-component system sensor kinase FixL